MEDEERFKEFVKANLEKAQQMVDQAEQEAKEALDQMLTDDKKKKAQEQLLEALDAYKNGSFKDPIIEIGKDILTACPEQADINEVIDPLFNKDLVRKGFAYHDINSKDSIGISKL